MHIKEKRKAAISLILRVVAVSIFVLLIVPYSFFQLALSINDIVTVKNINDEGHALLIGEFSVLNSMPDGSTIDKLEFNNDFPSSDFYYNIYCSIPANEAEPFFEYHNGRPLEERYDGKYLYSVSLINKGADFNIISVQYSVKNGASSDLGSWIYSHGSKTSTPILITYWFVVIAVIVALVFPYSKIKKKRINH